MKILKRIAPIVMAVLLIASLSCAAFATQDSTVDADYTVVTEAEVGEIEETEEITAETEDAAAVETAEENADTTADGSTEDDSGVPTYYIVVGIVMLAVCAGMLVFVNVSSKGKKRK